MTEMHQRIGERRDDTAQDAPSVVRLLEGNLFRSECGEEGFESRFALRLSSHVPGDSAGAGDSSYDSFILEHALSALEPGQGLRFVFLRQPGAVAEKSITFDIQGYATDSLQSGAETSATVLYDTLARLMAARRDCRYEPVMPEGGAYPCRYMVQPEGMLLTSDNKPSLAGQKSRAPIVLPAVSMVEAQVPFWEAFLGCTFPVEIAVTATPVRLEADALGALAETLKALDTPAIRCKTLPGQQWLNPEQIHLHATSFSDEIKRWLTIPNGIRFGIELRTAAPTSPGALQWMAQTFFPARRFHVCSAERVGLHDAPGAIDLRNCMNEGKAMPDLLPSRSTVRKIARKTSFPAPEAAMSAEGIVLGKTWGEEVRLADADRDRHCYIIGATGCGKSTLLRNLVMQDIEAGEGVCLIDPHGDLYRDVLRSIPLHRAKDVILLNPTDFDRAVGLNYLEIPGAAPAIERSFVANELLKMLDRLYDMREAGGPMFETYARNSLLLLMENRIRGLTLVELPLIFESESFRKHLLRNCTNPAVKRFWQEQAERANDQTSLHNMAPYITSKFNQFCGNALIRNIVGQSYTTIDFRAAMDRRKILLVNLSKGFLGEFDASFLGMLIVSKLFVAALGRARMEREARQPFHLYIDEFQNFTTDTIASLLSEARKFGIRLTLANQHLTQINVGHGAGNLGAAVLGNVGTLLAMRLGAGDAEYLNGILGSRLDSRTLQNMPDYHVAARLLVAGRPVPPFVFQTMAPVKVRKNAIAQNIIRKFYVDSCTRPVGLIEQEIARRAKLDPRQDR